MASFSKFSIISYSKNLLPVKYIDIPFLEHIQLPASLRDAQMSLGPCASPKAPLRARSDWALTLAPTGVRLEPGRQDRFAQNHPGEGPLGYRTGGKMLARGWYVGEIYLPVSSSTIFQ